MICNKCQFKNVESAKYCENCGAKLSKTSDEKNKVTEDKKIKIIIGVLFSIKKFFVKLPGIIYPYLLFLNNNIVKFWPLLLVIFIMFIYQTLFRYDYKINNYGLYTKIDKLFGIVELRETIDKRDY